MCLQKDIEEIIRMPDDRIKFEIWANPALHSDAYQRRRLECLARLLALLAQVSLIRWAAAHDLP